MDADAVVFDAYGTLFDLHAIEAACARVTADPATMSALWRRAQLETTWLRSLMGRYEDFWRITEATLEHAAAAVGARLDLEGRRALMDAWLELPAFPDAAAALHRLAPRPLAVLSNGTPGMLEAALDAAGLLGRFAHVLSADEVRVFKPAPEVYALAERRLGMERRRILFVSGNAWDAAGAKAFGMAVAWVDRAGTPAHRLTEFDLHVADLAELADAVSLAAPRPSGTA